MHTTPDQKTPGLGFWAKAMAAACGLLEDNTGFACCCLAGGDGWHTPPVTHPLVAPRFAPPWEGLGVAVLHLVPARETRLILVGWDAGV